MSSASLVKNKFHRANKWRPPVFKNVSKNLFVRTAIAAVSFAISAVIVVFVSDVLNPSSGETEEKIQNPHLRRLVAFSAALVAGAVSYLTLAFLFGTGN